MGRRQFNATTVTAFCVIAVAAPREGMALGLADLSNAEQARASALLEEIPLDKRFPSRPAACTAAWALESAISDCNRLGTTGDTPDT